MTPMPGTDGADQLRILLEPGQTFELPDGRGSITFDRVERFAGLSIRTDPGKALTLVARCWRWPGSSPRSSSAVDGCSCGLRPGASRDVLWSPSAAWPRTTTKACPTGSTEILDAVQRRKAHRDDDQTLAELLQPRRSTPRWWSSPSRCSRYAMYLARPGARTGTGEAAAEPRRRARGGRGRRPAGAGRAGAADRQPTTAPDEAAGRRAGPRAQGRRHRADADLARRSCSSSPASCCGLSRCTAGRWATCSSSPSSARCSSCSPTASGPPGATCAGSGLFVVTPGAAHPRAGHHRLVHRGRRADAVAASGLAGHPRHRGDAVGRDLHDRLLAAASSTSSKDALESAPAPAQLHGPAARRPGASSGSPTAVHIVAFPLWTFTLIAGAIWARQAWGSYWNWDPKEVWSFVIWVVYAAYLHARATSGVEAAERRVDRPRRLRLHHRQLRRGQRVLRRPALLLGTLIAPCSATSCCACSSSSAAWPLLWLLGLRDRDEQILLLVLGAPCSRWCISFFVLARFREDYAADRRARSSSARAAKQASAPPAPTSAAEDAEDAEGTARAERPGRVPLKHGALVSRAEARRRDPVASSTAYAISKRPGSRQHGHQVCGPWRPERTSCSGLQATPNASRARGPAGRSAPSHDHREQRRRATSAA